ncbi:antiterminator Q family protein [Pleionea sediminis]|uniref:antiterminator Q family protein n=1 Tax=Pleionea sediminis TaxID=2569479 RepID=UPI001185827B|nr:antiterminator Q family protein [Pleionea sediminis]
MSFQTTERNLKQWGYWKRSHGIHLGYGESALAIRKPIGYTLTDDEALAVDKAVSELKVRTSNSMIGSLVEDYFLEPEMSYLDLASRYKLKKPKVREMILIGVGWVDARIQNHTETRL